MCGLVTLKQFKENIMEKYRKFLVAVLAVVLTGLNVLYGNDSVVQLVIGLASAYGVYRVPNAR